MTRARIVAVSFLLSTFVTGVAFASWYDDYDAGVAAARAGNWSVVVQKMTSAIKGNGSENNKARTYGAIFINYHPYYYRGAAYLNLGKYEQAISDLEKTSGPGPENLGSIDTLMDRAKKQLAAAAEPAPEPVRPAPTPAPVQPAPVIPSAPAIDGALKQRAAASISAAKQKLQAAQQRRAANTPQYSQASTLLTSAITKNASARTNDDLNEIIDLANNAGDLFDVASAAPVIASTTPSPSIATPAPVVPKAASAASVTLADQERRVRQALEFYFQGEFEDATRLFKRLSEDLPTNAWIYAFLGASQYSQYAFEANEAHRKAALKSFAKARQYGKWKNGLPEKYFSKRIRRAFSDTAG